MTVHFADPGYDATALIVSGIVAGAFFLVPLFFAVVHMFRNGRGGAGDWAFATFIAALGVLIICAVAGSGTASGVYNNRIDTALYAEMAKAGFDGIQIMPSRQHDVPDNLDATLRGKPFVGTIEKLPYPKDFAYLITEGR